MRLVVGWEKAWHRWGKGRGLWLGWMSSGHPAGYQFQYCFQDGLPPGVEEARHGLFSGLSLL